jgi:signal transduction histidine kinase
MILAAVVADLDDADSLEARRLQTLGRLVPGALHELANPLLVLGGTVEFLLDEAETGAKARERLELVQSTAAEIADIVKTLQRLARERFEPETTIALASFVEETAELARRFSGIRDVELVVRAAGAALVDARPAPLRVAVLGPVLDALAAAEHGGTVVLEVDGSAVRLDGRDLALTRA